MPTAQIVNNFSNIFPLVISLREWYAKGMKMTLTQLRKQHRADQIARRAVTTAAFATSHNPLVKFPKTFSK